MTHPSDDDDGTPGTDPEICGFNQLWPITTYRFSTGWSKDTRNDFLLPTAGTYNRVALEFSIPGSTIDYYKLSYVFEYYKPLLSWLVL